MVGASNELPEGQELAALYDRFLLRLHVGPVSEAGFERLLSLAGGEPEVKSALQLRPSDLEDFHRGMETVELSADVQALLVGLRKWLAQRQITVSDRRFGKIVKLLKASAHSHGRAAVSIWDCWLLQHCVWDEPEQREKVLAWYTERVGVTADWNPERLTRLVGVWEARLKQDQDSRSQVRDKAGQLLFVGHGGERTVLEHAPAYITRDGEEVYRAPDEADLSDPTNGGRGFTTSELGRLQWMSRNRRLEHWSGFEQYIAEKRNRLTKVLPHEILMEPTPYPPVYIKDRVGEMEKIAADIKAWRERLADHIGDCKTTVTSHLWGSADFAGPAVQALEAIEDKAKVLERRIQVVQQGFARLPVRKDPGDDA